MLMDNVIHFKNVHLHMQLTRWAVERKEHSDPMNYLNVSVCIL